MLVVHTLYTCLKCSKHSVDTNWWFISMIYFAIYSANAGLMLAHRLRRWPNIKLALAECLVLARAASYVSTAIANGINTLLACNDYCNLPLFPIYISFSASSTSGLINEKILPIIRTHHAGIPTLL